MWFCYDNDNKCIPYQKVKIDISENDFIQIGTFNFVVMACMINVIKFRADEDKDTMKMYNAMYSHLFQIRNFFLRSKNKTILNSSIFQEFTINCIGNAIDPLKEHHLKIKMNRKLKKRLIFRYDPTSKTPVENIQFANISGNEIKNPRNLKIIL